MAMIKCSECGKDVSNTAAACPHCGAPVISAPLASAPAVKNRRKPIKNSTVLILIALPFLLFVVLPITILGMEDTEASSERSVSSSSASQPERAAPEPEKAISSAPESSVAEGEGEIGVYYVKIKAVELTVNYDDKPAVLVTYEWTNNSDESKAFIWSLDDTVYQNGIECEASLIKLNDSDDGNSKEIQPGVTFEFKQGYILNDEISDIDVEVSEYLTFSSPTIVSRTFKIS